LSVTLSNACREKLGANRAIATTHNEDFTLRIYASPRQKCIELLCVISFFGSNV
jgi:hypothetical protein